MTIGEALAWVAWPFWNVGERRPRALWRILLWGLIVNLVALPLARFVRGTDDVAARLLFTAALASVGVMIATALVDRRGLAELGLQPSRRWLADFAFGLALGAALMTAIFGVELALGWVTPIALSHSLDPVLPFHLGYVEAILAFLAVGFYEELTSRGYLLRNLADGLAFPALGRRGGLVLATALSSGLFGWGHADNPNATAVAVANVTLAGVLLALPYLLTGRLALSIGLHITWNFFQGAVWGLPVSGMRMGGTLVAIEQGGPPLWTGGAFGPEAGLLGVIAMFVGMGAILLWVRHRGPLQLAATEILGPAAILPEPLSPAPAPDAASPAVQA